MWREGQICAKNAAGNAVRRSLHQFPAFDAQRLEPEDAGNVDGQWEGRFEIMGRINIDAVDTFLPVLCHVFGNAQSHGRAKVDPSSAEGCFLQGEQMNRTAPG